jgi:hypothetical protein
VSRFSAYEIRFLGVGLGVVVYDTPTGEPLLFPSVTTSRGTWPVAAPVRAKGGSPA